MSLGDVEPISGSFVNSDGQHIRTPHERAAEAQSWPRNGGIWTLALSPTRGTTLDTSLSLSDLTVLIHENESALFLMSQVAVQTRSKHPAQGPPGTQ